MILFLYRCDAIDIFTPTEIVVLTYYRVHKCEQMMVVVVAKFRCH